MSLAGITSPNEIHPALTDERMSQIGQVIGDCALAVARAADWHRGDDHWVLGCRRYNWVRLALTNAAIGEAKDFLSVSPRSTHFIIKIHGGPARIYRGTKAKPAPKRYSEPSVLESSQLEFALNSAGIPDTQGRLLRFVLETDDRAMPIRLLFARVDRSGALSDICEIAVKRDTRELELRSREPKAAVPPLSLFDAAAKRARRTRPTPKGTQEGAQQ